MVVLAATMGLVTGLALAPTVPAVARGRVRASSIESPEPTAEMLTHAGQRYGSAVAVTTGLTLVGSSGADGGDGAVDAYVPDNKLVKLQPSGTLAASDGTPGDGFGSSLALAGRGSTATALVGAPGRNGSTGAVYVFTEIGGIWTQKATLTASDGVAGDGFGSSVAMTMTPRTVMAVIGAPGSGGSTGAAYVFTESRGTWSQAAELSASDAATGADFGVSVAWAGSSAVIGADGSQSATGAAYVFTAVKRHWGQRARLAAGDGADGDGFGHAVAATSDRVAIGAPGHDSTTGAVYVYSGSGADWLPSKELTASTGTAGDAFGDAVAIGHSLDYFSSKMPKPVADTAIVAGAPGRGGSLGVAYVFDQDSKGSGGWGGPQMLGDPDPSVERLGTAVAVSGTNIMAGAPIIASDTGEAFWYSELSGIKGAFGLQQRLQVDSEFGDKLAVSGDTAVVASQFSTYVFTLSGSTWTESATLGVPGGIAPVGQIAISGSMIVISGVGPAETPEAFVFTESAGVWSQTALLQPSPDTGDSQPGGVAISGTSVLLGGIGGAGSVYVFSQSGGVWSQTAVLTASDGATGSNFGETVATSGSLAMIGAPQQGGKGAVYVFTDTAGVWSQTSELTASDGAGNDNFGVSVDIDGSEAAIGSYAAPQGAVYVFDESGGTWTQSAQVGQTDGVASDNFFIGAISGATLLVSVPTMNGGAGADVEYTDIGGTWSPTADLTAPDGGPDQSCGASFALTDTTAFVGCPLDDSRIGAVFAFST